MRSGVVRWSKANFNLKMWNKGKNQVFPQICWYSPKISPLIFPEKKFHFKNSQNGNKIPNLNFIPLLSLKQIYLLPAISGFIFISQFNAVFSVFNTDKSFFFYNLINKSMQNTIFNLFAKLEMTSIVKRWIEIDFP